MLTRHVEKLLTLLSFLSGINRELQNKFILQAFLINVCMLLN